MEKYLQKINEVIAAEVNRLDDAILFGENLDRGSYLSGLSKNLISGKTRRIVNVGNCEYTHCGVGFGVMMGGGNAVLFVKQLDFMLLGIDHFVSTYHFIRSRPITDLGSFTIVAAIYDQGYQGPQSSFNSLSDICSMARISGFTLTNLADARKVASEEIPKPGFRIIGLSQRCAGDEIYEPENVDHTRDLTSFQYSTGKNLTIICANFTLSHGIQIRNELLEKGIESSLFTVNPTYASDWTQLIKDAKTTGRVLILDDSKGLNMLGYRVVQAIVKDAPSTKVRLVSRNSEIDFGVSSEEFKVPQSEIDLIME
jgi:pyruvate/2-oxoglutarate/acetoin dehydrogenase E1 component